MLEITMDNCHKCDLETIIDPNNSQKFWINRRDLEIESKLNWQAIFDNCKDSSKQKYEDICDEQEKTFLKKKTFLHSMMMKISN